MAVGLERAGFGGLTCLHSLVAIGGSGQRVRQTEPSPAAQQGNVA